MLNSGVGRSEGGRGKGGRMEGEGKDEGGRDGGRGRERTGEFSIEDGYVYKTYCWFPGNQQHEFDISRNDT